MKKKCCRHGLSQQKKLVKVEILPAKAIASKKPPNRKKGSSMRQIFWGARWCQCVTWRSLCHDSQRTATHSSVQALERRSIDVSGAFLQAPRRNTTTATIVQPPRILQQLNIVSAQERWMVCCAPYDRVESPVIGRNVEIKVWRS